MSPPSVDPTPTPRSLLRSVAAGVGVGVGVAAIAYFLIAIPIYTVASFDPNGMDRPVIRNALVLVALPVAALIGVAAGVYTGRAMRRGDRWPLPADEGRYTTH